MHTGVFLSVRVGFDSGWRLPRAYGGVSYQLTSIKSRGGSSPCIRGCFSSTDRPFSSKSVFPVHTGVFPGLPDSGSITVSLPRAYGGVSSGRLYRVPICRSSPCIRGCFSTWTGGVGTVQVFPVHTGVFLAGSLYSQNRDSLPRAYGGVSNTRCRLSTACWSSPCIRGCFQHAVSIINGVLVFPVHTGVFLKNRNRSRRRLSLPRAYGGVSGSRVLSKPRKASSPCIRGCFRDKGVARLAGAVFPVHTGVFPIPN